MYIDFCDGNTIEMFNEGMDASDILGLRLSVAALRKEETVSKFIDAIDKNQFMFTVSEAYFICT